ncbi:hypothetical protein PC129_g3925 [Phytophthora cactorum]|uniref:Uncharacterized protein n=2 Tax=Phytophthora cactorum TaxID=29920 RepID=A0A329SDX9_9STRA|nr:hypothetical protein Pcac1_g22711 [Phytophthora cactorum]KAG2837321.1 hypothetical protein PC111_g4693 [Phytophthora cactorum]KAG2844073.1 hypothetical protein PC112_g2362 [Phytophthora cactorum]KAG2862868.1 hypothetical protein PC113_g5911 [Phytophthora cactorum]KAG2930029.1 hypothetical protein PC114_g2585 [Phytophthora cactorum]
MVLHEEDSDELLSRLFRRCHGATSPAKPRSQSAKGRRYGNELQTLAVTNVRDLSRELDTTERALHPNKPVITDFSKLPPLNKQMKHYPTWDELEEIFRELHDLYERRDKVLLSLREQEYAALLTHAAVKTLTQACVASERGDLDASGVRVKLLEVAVRPSAQWRRLAFTLLLSTSVGSLTAILSTQEDSSTTRAQHLEANLFKLLREMLAKAVVVSTSLASEPIVNFHHDMDWVDQAVGCLEFFVKKANGNYSSDRLRCLDEHTLLFLVAEASNRDSVGSELQRKAMELVVATMYAFKVGKSESKDHTVWNCGLPVAAVEQYVSMELLLYHFYTSPVARLQRLACMVLVDLVCEQLRRAGSREGISNAGLDQNWKTFVDWEDPSVGMRHALLSPYVSSSRVVKQLASSCSLVSEKQLNAFVNQFRLLTQVDAYFGVNPSLDKAVKATKNHSSGSISEELLDQVLKLLLSNRAVERFRGERWLAELLTYGQDDDGFSSYDSKATTTVGSVRKQPEVLLVRPKPVNSPAGEELEETFCYDEGGEISLAAQAKFWELASPTNAVGLRVSFTKVLALFIRRKLQLSSGKPDASIIEEINTCLSVLLDRKESEPAVLVPVMLLILDICQCELSYIDNRWKQRDSRTSSDNKEEEALDRVAWSDSLASRVLNGDVALDRTLLRQLDAEFILHVLTVLYERSDTHQGFECRRVCCGVDDSLVGDVAACTALVVFNILSDNDIVVAKVGGLAALTPFLQACDTRVALFMAKLISELVKHSDETQYAAFLRELYVACVEADDESALYNSYLHTQTLLHNVEVDM